MGLTGGVGCALMLGRTCGGRRPLERIFQLAATGLDKTLTDTTMCRSQLGNGLRNQPEATASGMRIC